MAGEGQPTQAFEDTVIVFEKAPTSLVMGDGYESPEVTARRIAMREENNFGLLGKSATANVTQLRIPTLEETEPLPPAA